MNESINQNTGFGERSTDMGGRMVNKDGTFNIRRIGIRVHHRVSNYQNMLTMPRWQFLLVIFFVYLLINCFFTALYWYSGTEGLQGISHQKDSLGKLKEVFFFSRFKCGIDTKNNDVMATNAPIISRYNTCEIGKYVMANVPSAGPAIPLNDCSIWLIPDTRSSS